MVRAGEQPPASLVNGTTTDTSANTQVPSALLTPIWVTPKNMAATAVKDRFVDAAKLCAGKLAKVCQSDGIPR